MMATCGPSNFCSDEVRDSFYLQTDPDLEESRRTIGDEIKDKCQAHREKLKELFCKDHKVFLCTICVALDHRQCAVGYIPSLSEDLFDSPDYKSFKNSLEILIKSLDCIKRKASQNIAKSKSDARNALSRLKNFRKEINDYLHKVETVAVVEIWRMEREDQKRIDKLSEQCDILYKEIQSLQQDLSKKENKNQKCQLFVDIQTHTQASTIDKYRNEVSRLSYTNRVGDLEFVPSPTLSGLVSDLCRIGASVLDDKYGSKTLDLSKVMGPIISIECISNAICVRESNGNLALIDTTLQKITNRLRSEYVSYLQGLYNAVSGAGSYITNVSENEIAVVVHHGIDIYSASNLVKLQKTVKLSLKNKLLALAYANNRFIVATNESPPTLRILDMNGGVVTTFPAKIDGKPLFKDPRFLAINPDQTLIYVSDLGTHTVTCVTFTGEVRAKYGPFGTWELVGVTVSRDGTVYIANYRQNDIHILSSDLQKIGVIHGADHGFTTPRVLAYCEKQHKLYVSSDSTKFVILNL